MRANAQCRVRHRVIVFLATSAALSYFFAVTSVLVSVEKIVSRITAKHVQ